MGSCLKEAASGKRVWGFTQLVQYTRVWRPGGAFERLAVTPEERDGELGRIVPDGLLQMPAAMPMLRGQEPYTDLLASLLTAVADKAALLEFAYDWRLSIEHNARCLAREARTHLDRWREHAAHESAPVKREPRLVIVAHSMGGLVARALSLVEGHGDTPQITDDVRATVTLGSPFQGAVKAAVLLETGGGTPLGRLSHDARMRALAVTLPGVYDLLPRYRCIADGNDLRCLTENDVTAMGGNDELAQQATERSQRLGACRLVGHRAMVGTGQRTMQAARFKNGVLAPLYEDFERSNGAPVLDEGGRLIARDADGDETVARDAAMLMGVSPQYLPQQHGALAKSPEVVSYVADVVTEREGGFAPWLGATQLGIEVPDVVAPHEELVINLTGGQSAGAVGCAVYDAQTGKRAPGVRLERRDGQMQALVTLRAPGVYRVKATGGGTSSVTQLVLVAKSDA
jgi:pimeloyl-ACP methyl ester carboxylesterase